MALVCHMEKYKASDCGGIQTEDNRESDAINKKNRDLDLSKTHLNKHYTYDTNCGEMVEAERATFLDVVRYHKWRINSLREASGQSRLRKDAVVCCSFIVGADADFMNTLTYEQQQEYFKCAVEWFNNRYGVGSVMEYSMHFDESTPHMHLRLLPEVEVGCLSAKAMFNRAEMGKIQRELPKWLNKHGYAVEAGKEGNKVKHLNEQDFKIAKVTEKLSSLEAEIAFKRAEIEKRQNDLSEAEKRLYEVNKSLEELLKQSEKLQGGYQACQEVQEYLEDIKKLSAILNDEHAKQLAQRLEPRTKSLKERIAEAGEVTRQRNAVKHSRHSRGKTTTKKDYGDR